MEKIMIGGGSYTKEEFKKYVVKGGDVNKVWADLKERHPFAFEGGDTMDDFHARDIKVGTTTAGAIMSDLADMIQDLANSALLWREYGELIHELFEKVSHASVRQNRREVLKEPLTRDRY